MKYLFLMAIGLIFQLQAANVEWNLPITMEHRWEETYHFAWLDPYLDIQYPFEIFCSFASDANGRNWVLSPDECASSGLVVYEAAKGEIVSREVAQNVEDVFVRMEEGWNHRLAINGEPWTSISHEQPLSFYLAIVVTQGDDAYVGWVELSVKGEVDGGYIYELANAFDFDGGPMIVGGGSAIPEPSSALLLLVGGALLALRRKRRKMI